MLILLALASAPAFALPTITAEQAIANFHEQQRLARAGMCRTGDDDAEIVVCGRPLEESPYRTAGRNRFQRFAEQPTNSLFEVNFGPVSLGCCTISTGNGSGAGLGLSIRF